MRKVIGIITIFAPFIAIALYFLCTEFAITVFVFCGTVFIVDLFGWGFWFYAAGMSIIEGNKDVWKWGK